MDKCSSWSKNGPAAIMYQVLLPVYEISGQSTQAKQTLKLKLQILFKENSVPIGATGFLILIFLLCFLVRL